MDVSGSHMGKGHTSSLLRVIRGQVRGQTEPRRPDLSTNEAIWYRIPDAREIRVNRANLTRFTLREPLWDAWCDSIRVLIRVLADRDLNRLADTAHCHPWRPRQVTGPY